MTWAQWLQEMAKEGENWGDHVALTGLCNMLDVNIKVFSKRYNYTFTPISKGIQRDTIIISHLDELHFMSIESL